MAKAARRITIEQDEARLRVIAEPPPLWPIFLAGIGVAVLCGNLLRMLYPMYQREMRSYSGMPGLFVAIAGVTVLLCVTTIVVLWRRMLRLRAPCGIDITRGEVIVYTPDDTTLEHRFALVELKAAEMRSSAKISHLADLILYRRSGGRVAAVRWVAPGQLSPVIDRINALLLIDRFYGFEVVVPDVQYELTERPTARPPPIPAAAGGGVL